MCLQIMNNKQEKVHMFSYVYIYALLNYVHSKIVFILKYISNL